MTAVAIWKCRDCDTNNAPTATACQVCDQPRRVSHVRGSRVSRVRKNLRHNG